MQIFGQIIYYFSLAILSIESITYSGFFEKHTHLSIWYILAVVGLLSNIIPWEKIIKQIKSWYLYVFVGGWIGLTIIDCAMYPNFVFSRFHVNLESTSMFMGFLLWPRFVKYLHKQSIFVVFACFLSLLYAIPALQRTVASGLTRNKHEIGHLNKTYDEKMAEVYGPSYYYYKFVVENTSPDSKIVTPPMMAPWIRTGNAGLSRYFLGTRNIANGDEEFISDIKNYDYIMISSETVNSGSSYKLWPEFKIDSTEITVFNPETKEVSTLPSYDPKYFSNNRLWGLIKVLK